MLIATHISFFVKDLFIFLLAFYVFSFLSCVNFLYILDCISQSSPEKQNPQDIKLSLNNTGLNCKDHRFFSINTIDPSVHVFCICQFNQPRINSMLHSQLPSPYPSFPTTDSKLGIPNHVVKKLVNFGCKGLTVESKVTGEVLIT